MLNIDTINNIIIKNVFLKDGFILNTLFEFFKQKIIIIEKIIRKISLRL